MRKSPEGGANLRIRVPIRTYVDSNVILSAWNGELPLHEESLAILADQDRDFLSTSLVELETVAHATFGHRQKEVEFLRMYFDVIVTDTTTVGEDLVSEANEIACATDAGGIDAMHIAAAKRLKADQLITREKPTKPMHRTDFVVHVKDV